METGQLAFCKQEVKQKRTENHENTPDNAWQMELQEGFFRKERQKINGAQNIEGRTDYKKQCCLSGAHRFFLPEILYEP